jgi:hypothetical protein
MKLTAHLCNAKTDKARGFPPDYLQAYTPSSVVITHAYVDHACTTIAATMNQRLTTLVWWPRSWHSLICVGQYSNEYLRCLPTARVGLLSEWFKKNTALNMRPDCDNEEVWPDWDNEYVTRLWQWVCDQIGTMSMWPNCGNECVTRLWQWPSSVIIADIRR